MIVVDLDPVLRNHMTRALSVHFKWLRANGVPAPRALVELLEGLAGSGQERTRFDVSGDDGHADIVHLLLDYEAAGTRLGVSSRTVRRLVTSGRLRAVNIGGCRRIRASDLVAYVERLEVS